jgi:hypothetical protein
MLIIKYDNEKINRNHTKNTGRALGLEQKEKDDISIMEICQECIIG